MSRYLSKELVKKMKKYMPERLLETCVKHEEDYVDDKVFAFVSKYINSHLPVEMELWAEANKDICGNIKPQLELMERIARIFCIDQSNVVVTKEIFFENITIHPVFHLSLKPFELRITAVCNEKGEWFASFLCDQSIDIDEDFIIELDASLGRIFEADQAISSVLNYGSYENNQKRFTAVFKSNYDFYAFCILVKNALSL